MQCDCMIYGGIWACGCNEEQKFTIDTCISCGGKPERQPQFPAEYLCPDHEAMRRDADAEALSKFQRTKIFHLDVQSEYAQALRNEDRLIDAEYWKQKGRPEEVFKRTTFARSLYKRDGKKPRKLSYSKLIETGVRIPYPQLLNPHRKAILAPGKRQRYNYQSTPQSGSSAIGSYAMNGDRAPTCATSDMPAAEICGPSDNDRRPGHALPESIPVSFEAAPLGGTVRPARCAPKQQNSSVVKSIVAAQRKSDYIEPMVDDLPNSSVCSAFSQHTKPSDNWLLMSDSKERKRAQGRLAQQKYRKLH